MAEEDSTPKRPHAADKTGFPAQPTWAKARPYVWVSAGAFVASVGILAMLLMQAEKLVEFGLVGPLYFLVLVPLGLGVAAFLFGVLRSYASYKGRRQGGWLQLGGPIVGFAMVLVLGFSLGHPDNTSFDLTVFLEGEGGPADAALPTNGTLLLIVGAAERQAPIHGTSQLTFPQLAPQFRRAEVKVRLQSDNFEIIRPLAAVRLTGRPLTVVVRRKDVTLAVRIKNGDGAPVAGAAVKVGTVEKISDSYGEVIVTIAGPETNKDVDLRISATGYQFYEKRFPLGVAPVTVILRKAQ